MFRLGFKGGTAAGIGLTVFDASQHIPGAQPNGKFLGRQKTEQKTGSDPNFRVGDCD
jgi:hypothetical protein